MSRSRKGRDARPYVSSTNSPRGDQMKFDNEIESGSFEEPQGGVAMVKKVMLKKQQIIEAKDIQYFDVNVPEWAPEGSTDEEKENCFVLIKTLSGKERDAFEASMIQGVGKAQRIDMQNVRAKFCSLIIVDPDTRERMFGKPEIDLLAAKSAPALQRVYDKGMEVSRFTKEDIEELVSKSDSDQLVV